MLGTINVDELKNKRVLCILEFIKVYIGIREESSC